MKLILLLLLLFCFSSMAQGQTSDTIYNLLVGTYTTDGKSQGIYVYSFNTQTGEWANKAEALGIRNPSYLAISHDRKFVYSVAEDGDGTISSFSFDALTGKMIFLNNVSSGGASPCYVSVDDKNRFVFTGNYMGGSLSAIPIAADGSLRTDSQTFQHQGSSIKPNQDGPHVHAAVLSKDNRFLFVPDLGTDKVNMYTVDYSKPKPLAPAEPAFAKVTVGGGPRHFVFHPNNKYAYVILENTGDITAFDYANGKLKEKQMISMVTPGFSGRVSAADIHISPDGKFLYGSMRGDIHELGIYSIDKKGKLTFVGRQSTLGKTPRNFEIDPSGNFLLVGNQDSDEIVIFHRNKNTGLLIDSGKRIPIGKPVCLKFVAVN